MADNNHDLVVLNRRYTGACCAVSQRLHLTALVAISILLQNRFVRDDLDFGMLIRSVLGSSFIISALLTSSDAAVA